MAIIDVQDVRMRPESRTFKGLLDTGQQLRCFRHDVLYYVGQQWVGIE